MDIVRDGILLGLWLSLLTGPIFFALIQIAIERGFRAAMVFNLGVWVSDVFYICIIYAGVTQFADDPSFQFYLGTFGSLILSLFGLSLIFGKSKIEEEKPLNLLSYGGYFLKGILINVVNPFVLLLWIGVTSSMIDRSLSFNQMVLFFCSILGTYALFDLAKSLTANQIRSHLTTNQLLWMRRIAGMGILVSGVYLFIRVWW